MKTLILFVALFLFGCAGPSHRTHYNVIMRPDADPALDEAVLHAADVWKAGVNVSFDVSIGDCHLEDGVICIVPASRDEMAQLARADWHGFGLTFSKGGDVDGGVSYINVKDIPPEHLYVTVAHEMGHAMGLEQHSGPGTLMCGDASCDVGTITTEDANRWNVLRN